MADRHHPQILYIIVCGAGAAVDVGKLAEQAQQRGWSCHVIATPAGADFLDVEAVEQLTRQPVRSHYRAPDQLRDNSLPPPDGIIVAPATFNTVNKLACGINDNYALGLLAEAIGMRRPVVIVPFVNSALATNPAFPRAIATLRAAGVEVLHGPGELEPHSPRSGGDHIQSFPWTRALDRLEAAFTLSGLPGNAENDS